MVSLIPNTCYNDQWSTCCQQKTVSWKWSVVAWQYQIGQQAPAPAKYKLSLPASLKMLLHLLHFVETIPATLTQTRLQKQATRFFESHNHWSDTRDHKTTNISPYPITIKPHLHVNMKLHFINFLCQLQGIPTSNQNELWKIKKETHQFQSRPNHHHCKDDSEVFVFKVDQLNAMESVPLLFRCIMFKRKDGSLPHTILCMNCFQNSRRSVFFIQGTRANSATLPHSCYYQVANRACCFHLQHRPWLLFMLCWMAIDYLEF